MPPVPRSAAVRKISRAVVRGRGTGVRCSGDTAPTGRHDHRYRAVVRARRAPPSAHLNVSGRAPAVNPTRGLTAVAMRPQPSPCVRMGAPNPPATGRALSALTNPNDMHSPNTFEQRYRMPYCDSCRHKGEDHNWRVPPCHECEGHMPGCLNCRRNRELRRLRGACLISQCICSRYVPYRVRRKPVNPLIGRLRYERR